MKAKKFKSVGAHIPALSGLVLLGCAACGGSAGDASSSVAPADTGTATKYLTISEGSDAIFIDLLGNESSSAILQQAVQSARAETGQVELMGGGMVSYAAPDNFHGDDQINYTVVTASSQMSAVMHIQISPVNDPPSAVADTAVVKSNSVGQPISPLLNDFDIDGDELTLVSALAAFGKAGITANQVAYTPNAGFLGTDTIEYRIQDEMGAVSKARITIQVEQDSSASVALSWEAPTIRENGDPLDVAAIAGYKILVTKLDTPATKRIVTITDGRLMHHSVDVYSSGEYEFRISAVDENGVYSPPSDALNITLGPSG